MGLITRQYNYVAGRTIRASELNTNENTIFNEINGNIQDVNLKSDTITERVLTDDINPLIRDADKYASFVVSGLNVADASLGDTARVSITEGTIYTIYNNKMYRKNTSSETYTLTNSDNGTYYLHVDYQGTFYDTASPDPTAGRQVVAKLEVSGQPSSPSITVTDLRRTKLYDLISHHIHGCILSYNGVNTFTVSAGTVEIDNMYLTNTAQSSAIDITDTANYFEGSVVGTSQWCYIYVARLGTSLQWTVKLSTEAPQYADTNDNISGVLLYRKYDSKFYRCIGAVYRDSSGNIRKFYQDGNYVQYDQFAQVADSSNSQAYAHIPAISSLGYFELKAHGSTAQSGTVEIRPAGSSGSYVTVHQAYGRTQHVYARCFTNSSQKIDVQINPASITTVKTVGYWLNIR